MTDQFYAQAGEDVILANLFAGQENGTCLEVGALDGVRDSVTLYFEKKGWSCILIEANPELAAKAKTLRRARVFSCAAGKMSGTTELVLARGADYLSTTNPATQHIDRILQDGARIERITVPMMRVDDALEEAGVSRLDFVSIDVEGAELDVLKGFNLNRWRPKLLVIEDNDRAVRPYLRSQGYRCFLHAGWNNWYARKGDKSLLTPGRIITEYKRLARQRLYAGTIGFLPSALQAKLVKWKRKWLGNI